jgi:uncharacterized protein (DUF2236 family)
VLDGDRPGGSILRLPRLLQRRLDAAAIAFLVPTKDRRIDFTLPLGEQALAPPDSVSWRIFKNPIALYVGGLAAVILELAEPAVRAGVWEHSSFRKDPMGRLQRTAMAAMMTVYGARSIAEPMIAGVVRMHAKVAGQTPAGAAYSATDPSLLRWVQATAAFGFAEAYSRYVDPLSPVEIDALYREGAPAARLYGALDAPTSAAELTALFASMRDRLEPSHVIFEFLRIMRETPVLPQPLFWMQGILVRAAVEIIPYWLRERLALTESYGLRPWERWIARLAGRLSDRIVLAECPAALSCMRLGLPINHLYVSVAPRNRIPADSLRPIAASSTTCSKTAR